MKNTDVTVKLVSTETLEVMWSPVKGAELYETTAAHTNNVLHCNDTSPVCALSDLSCNTPYSVTVTPCSELRGCNNTCTPHKHETAPCAPEILDMRQTTNSTYRVLITTPNSPSTNYTITATGRYDKYLCQSINNSCEFTQLPCGSIYEVIAVATTAVGKSLPGYSKTLETATLRSPHGEAKCHTLDSHCLMGCITCGTNYSVYMDAISSTGHKSLCQYQGFSTSEDKCTQWQL
ncbi:hypothetical protein GOODEAATRI_018206 [Goodea atripinnis]|uniref:Fibronectin type-III domain-containing protein n=1 Tax=Goodea atripinnis TaxID=208336 RepID=A0ABV0PF31_9TELE